MAWADSDNAIVIESGLGIQIAPGSGIGDNYDLALGFDFNLLAGWRINKLTFFGIVERELFGQSSRHASAEIGSWYFGAGAMYRVHSWGSEKRTKYLEIIGYPQFGTSNISLRNDGNAVANMHNSVMRLTMGGRIYFTLGDNFRLFTGPELSYSNIDFKCFNWRNTKLTV